MKNLILICLLFVSFLVSPQNGISGQYDSPVQKAHLIMIESMFRDNGLMYATVNLDNRGRVLLGGSYKNSREVSLAFSLAESVVGVRWTSPVSPENVKVREWAQNISSLFPTKKVEEPPPPADIKTDNDGVKEKYALIVGVGRFKNDKTGKNNLKYAPNDAHDINDFLVEYSQYKKQNVTLLLNEDATVKNIQRSMDSIRQKANAGDEVFIYFSSHGAPVYDGSLNIVTYDTVFKNHFTMSESSYPSKSLKAFIEKTRANKVYIVLDVCYSGAAFKGIDGFYSAGSKSISFDDDNQGLSKEAMSKTLMGSKDITFEDDAANAAESNNISGSKVIISASDAGEKSWESDSFKASFFTHIFLQELKKGSDLKAAFETAQPKVIKNVKSEKKADQHPQVIASKSDWGH